MSKATAPSGESKKELAYAIIQFLDEEIKSAAVSEDAAESLEVVIQCLESAYGVSLQDPDCVSKYRRQDSLLTRLEQLKLAEGAPVPSEPTEEEKADAERCKTQGNELMKVEKYNEAIESYSKSIHLDPYNAVYYCNRAAAYSKLEKHQSAIDDCEQAIALDEKYSKAYGRMGLAYSALEQHGIAVDCYRKALELDPGNESYRNNMTVAEEKSKQGSGEANTAGFPPGLGSLMGGGGMGGLGAVLQNPAFMNMATQMMSSPHMQEMMNNLMANQQQQPADTPPSAPPSNMDGLLRAGQQLAQQLQASNPELVSQLRQQMTGAPGDQPNDTDPNKPNPDNGAPPSS